MRVCVCVYVCDAVCVMGVTMTQREEVQCDDHGIPCVTLGVTVRPLWVTAVVMMTWV